MLSDKSNSEGGQLSTPLPPGFRFHPTDEELVRYYLTHKIASNNFFEAIGEVDFNKCEPWDLPSRAKIGEGMFYFFSLRDRKYPTGMRTNRATEAGYWKATGKDREVSDSDTGKLVGMKKTLVFYTGRAPKGEKTNWIMHEYRLEGEATGAHQQEWVICRVFEKSAPGKKPYPDFESTDDVSSNTGQPFSTLPGLQSLDVDSPAPSSNNLTYPGAGFSPSELFGSYNSGATIPGQETILRRSNGSTADISTSRARRDVQLSDSLDNLVSSYWDTYHSDLPWDANPGGYVP